MSEDKFQEADDQLPVMATEEKTQNGFVKFITHPTVVTTTIATLLTTLVYKSGERNGIKKGMDKERKYVKTICQNSDTLNY